MMASSWRLDLALAGRSDRVLPLPMEPSRWSIKLSRVSRASDEFRSKNFSVSRRQPKERYTEWVRGLFATHKFKNDLTGSGLRPTACHQGRIVVKASPHRLKPGLSLAMNGLFASDDQRLKKKVCVGECYLDLSASDDQRYAGAVVGHVFYRNDLRFWRHHILPLGGSAAQVAAVHASPAVSA